MKKERPFQNLLLISGMIGLLLLALVLDVLLSALTERNTLMGGLNTTLVWMHPLVQMLWMLGAVGLVWLMITGGGYSRWVCAVYIILGLFILYTNPILFVSELPESLYVLVQFLSPGTMLYQGGGMVAAIGLLSLWFWKEPEAAGSGSVEAGEAENEQTEGKAEDEELSELPG